MKRLFVAFLFLFPFQLSAQFYAGARQAAMANASAAMSGLDAVAGNPAGVTALQGAIASLSVEKEWLSGPIQSNGLFVVPTELAHAGLFGSLYQSPEYRELRLATALARQFSDRFSAGLRVSYQQHSFVQTAASVARLSADLGLQYKLRPHWTLGLELVNPLAQGASRESFRQAVKLGTQYAFSAQTLIALQAAYAPEGGADLAVGLEYGVLPWLQLRGGLSVNPFMHYCGVGLTIRAFRVDGAMRVHPQLGMSPRMRLAYAF
jgi:hypothetical protein